MAVQLINIGNVANDGTGDDLREAFAKVNNKFNDIDTRLENSAVDVENLGGVGTGIYAGTEDGVIKLKSLVAGTNTTLTSNGDTITINSSGGINSVLVLTDNGSITVDNSSYLGINGGEVISTRVSGNNLFIDLDNTGIVARDTQPSLSASLQANGNNIQNAGSVNANSFNGPLTGLVYGVDVRNVNYYYENWDFGDIVETQYTSIIDWIVKDTDIDAGDLIGSGLVDWKIDLGTIA